jgi:hypothetical protein
MMSHASVCYLALVSLALAVASAAAQAPAPQKQAAKPKPGRTLTDRYPLPYPPKLPEGKTVVTESERSFLVPNDKLREGIAIARTPPIVDFAFYPEQNYPGNPWSHRSDGIVVGDKYYSSSNDISPRAARPCYGNTMPRRSSFVALRYDEVLGVAERLPAGDELPPWQNAKPDRSGQRRLALLRHRPGLANRDRRRAWLPGRMDPADKSADAGDADRRHAPSPQRCRRACSIPSG